jgi:arginine kinase
MLSKFLTEDIWNRLHDKKDSLGVSFKQCILSGCQNTDSGIGVYAASPNSYEAFSELFTPIVEAYHKIKIDDGHTSNMDHTQLKCPPFPEEDAAMIKSTRIRVGRNLAAFPLGPGISREQRNEVEKLVTTALSTFTGDLKGTYYSLGSMTAQQQ